MDKIKLNNEKKRIIKIKDNKKIKVKDNKKLVLNDMCVFFGVTNVKNEDNNFSIN
tara:strand:- start:77 stop:241 length:165 start_codon:yes stop_codon:yes gene_type:complete